MVQELKVQLLEYQEHQQKDCQLQLQLYMPASVQVTYGAQYQDTPVGAVTEQPLNAYNDILAGRGTDASRTTWYKWATEIANSLQQFMLRVL